MALRRTISNYGGAKVNAQPIKNPEAQLDAAHYTLLAEEAAQMTRTTHRAIAKFTCVAAGNPALANTSVWTLWGSGDTHKPTIVRNAAGDYTLTWSATLANGQGTVEALGFVGGHVSVRTTTAADNIQGRLLSSTDNTARVVVQSAGAPSDTAASASLIEVTVWML